MKNILAAFMFFTRLPFWRLATVGKEYFKNVVSFWPYAGIITGGIGAGVMFAASLVFPVVVAVIFGVAARVLVTGALHEDGLADFFDGFGGGTDREAILRIMKDSHIGSYGVLGLILYFMLLVASLSSLPIEIAAPLFFCGDILCKSISSGIVNLLPYARPEQDSKNKLVYNKMQGAISLFNGILVVLLMWALYTWVLPTDAFYAIAAPMTLFIILIHYMRYKIQGYTGDCCGATFLLTELSFLLASVVLINTL